MFVLGDDFIDDLPSHDYRVLIMIYEKGFGCTTSCGSSNDDFDHCVIQLILVPVVLFR